jgi:hypothetical protein
MHPFWSFHEEKQDYVRLSMGDGHGRSWSFYGSPWGAHRRGERGGRRRGRGGAAWGWHGEDQGAAGGAAMEGLKAALLFVSCWGSSLLRAAVCEKEEGRRKREEKKRKEKKRKKRKNIKNSPNLKISEK